MSKKQFDEEQRKALYERLFQFMKGNQHAVRLLMDLFYVAQVWDDLIDGDNIRTQEEISVAFRKTLLDIPANPFYQKFQFDLRPLVLNAILQWQDANILDHGSDHDQHMAFMLRASIFQICNYCAYLIGGPDWIRQVGPDMRRIYAEDLNEYMQEMTKCQM